MVMSIMHFSCFISLLQALIWAQSHKVIRKQTVFGTSCLYQYVQKWAELDEYVCIQGGRRWGRRGRGGGGRVMISASHLWNMFFVCLWQSWSHHHQYTQAGRTRWRCISGGRFHLPRHSQALHCCLLLTLLFLKMILLLLFPSILVS